ncbi:MAG TPA: helix-turn-helix domain-containing protein [Microbacterium sp.]|nr:helix-turn-helix domain-containing protein [Microbacterium sp.]
MRNTFIQHFWPRNGLAGSPERKVLGRVRLVWDVLGHLCVMDSERISGLGLEPMLTTSELAEYLGVQAQAIYDLRADGRGPSGIRVGRDIRYRISDVRRWLERLHEPEPAMRRDRGGI